MDSNTEQHSLAPELGFPLYVEREWWGRAARTFTATVTNADDSPALANSEERDRLGRPVKHDRYHGDHFKADGLLAVVPLVYGVGEYVVRYYSAINPNPEKKVRLSVKRHAATLSATILSTW